MDCSADQLWATYLGTVERATQQLQQTVSRVDPESVEALASKLRGARRVACYGVGREGLAMKGLAMRLYHTGVQVGEGGCGLGLPSKIVL
jgi:D-arabinose 5-phosphate isomerase GutQ